MFSGRSDCRVNFMAVAIPAADGFDDGARLDAFVDVERDGEDFEGGMLFFAGPDELGIEMRVVVELLARFHGGDGRMVVVGVVRGSGRVG
jgi:hypothetical protein